MGTQETHKSLLQSIYDAEYFPLEGIATRTQEHWTKHQKIGSEILHFSKVFHEEDRCRFERFNSLILEVQEEELYYAYAEGLRTGLLLFSELLHRKY